ncbi:MAG: HlyC/CorC family transporter [Anaerolineae bacterium]|nr:HlyC/CorC family transporter [Anaerolineae bacterium]
MDPGSSSGIGIWVAAALLGLWAGFLVAVRAALMNVSRTRLRKMAEEGDAKAVRALGVVEESAQFLVTLEVSQFAVGMAAVALAVWAGVPLLAGWLAYLPGAALGGWVRPLALVVVLLAATGVALVVGWMVPQSLAVRHAEALTLRLAAPIAWMVALLSPPVGLLVRLGSALGRLLGGGPIGGVPVVTEEAIKTLVDAGEERGVIEEDEKEMIYSIFEFGDLMVREVMVPRIDIVAVEVSTPMLEALDVVMAAGYSRIPVYEETIDNIVGLLYAKDLLPYLRDGRTDVPLREVLREPYFIPETKKVDELLPDLQRRKVHMAIVVDEYGGVAGLVTIEDLLEEIVGEIQDEYDTEEPMVVLGQEGEFVFDARVSLDDVNKLAGVELTSDAADTLGGYVYEKLGQVPAVGDQIVEGDVEITVVAVAGRRIRRVRVRKRRPQPGDVEAADGVESAVAEGREEARSRLSDLLHLLF